ncbi:cell wall-binding protein YocH [Thalassobacillus devorans]|uniref:Cell wall-binding protein YocH n=1 Tax=Thalassobacillus devorans TaxID=279813 RepID=A0ABQ1P3S9_9BACI|nr:3D domain-containing protein [Thalassobacillus devorans]NIK28167.1 3D (Asp-Asp-Asp) domain-containing protein/LysM repeat protein [Thalassobacillus devorans]GGC88377.1 cell wall-binding protein YocH [Thalassobacillus devorans]
MKKTVVSLAAVTTISGGLAVQAQAHDGDYVVNKGDTLWGISQEYNLTVETLKDLNNLKSNTIYPDDKLTVSNEEGTPAVSSADYYTVKSGDTLWGISQDHGVSVNELKKWNQISTTTIYPGDQLSLKGAVEEESTTETEQTSGNDSAPEQTSSNESAEEDSSTEQTSQSAEGQTINVSATAYTANCTGCSGVTATGIDLNANPDKKVIAVDPNVIPLGSEVYVEGYGRAVAGDVGGAIKGNKIDIFMPERSDALEFGVQNVEVTILD